MTPISQSGNPKQFCWQNRIFRVLTGSAAGLFASLIMHEGLGQQTEIEDTVVIFSRTSPWKEVISQQIAIGEGNRQSESGLSFKAPKVPTVAEMTGKMGKAELLLQSSSSKVSASQGEIPNIREPDTQREWNRQATSWAAPNFYSHPLYFEQVNLERHHTKLPPCAIPLISYAHFLGSVPTLPYQVGYKHPGERSYSLGHKRPGDTVPIQIPWTPLTKRGLLYQGAATSGAIFLLP